MSLKIGTQNYMHFRAKKAKVERDEGRAESLASFEVRNTLWFKD
jgi:hypothetical protein